jgi:phosphoribosylaminoimidazolecarboxamide formyltransferase/IMP cyclohydrolase
MRALVSVYDKTNIVPFCKKLHELGVEIISTGGTGKLLTENSIPYITVEKVTQNKEAFGGRMKTISFEIMSSILFRRDNPTDQKEIHELGLIPIDMVVCNLYRFSDAIKNNYNLENTIELIDIGGPTMIRSAAKNYNSVTVITNPNSYEIVADEILKNKKVTAETNQKLALEALSYTAAYDLSIANELSKRFYDEVKMPLSSENKSLRYGENPHQKAELFIFPNTKSNITLANAPVLQGKEISFNNYLDADSAYKCMSELNTVFPNKSAVVIVKHGTPCGAAVANDTSKALDYAWECDNVSAFGGIIAFNSIVTKDIAQFFESKFVEVVIAPKFDTEALEIFSKKKNVRLIEIMPKTKNQGEKTIRSINGGFLVQDEDELLSSELTFKNVTKNNFESINDQLIYFGQTLIKYKKSNCLMLAQEVNGVMKVQASGVGQPNRLHCMTKLIGTKIKNTETANSVLFSDAFFPFADSIEEAHKMNIKYIVQPGGSIKDNEVIAKCDEFNIAMKFSGSRHFRH